MWSLCFRNMSKRFEFYKSVCMCAVFVGMCIALYYSVCTITAVDIFQPHCFLCDFLSSKNNNNRQILYYVRELIFIYLSTVVNMCIFPHFQNKDMI